MALLTRDDKDDTRILIKVSDLDLNHLGLKMVVVLLFVEVAKCSWSQRFKYKVHKTCKTWLLLKLGHLTSKSDVYSFGVVLLELLTGRRSIDKNRPIGQQNLVAWARPFMIDRRWFFRLMDPQLEGRFSIKGAPRAIQLAAQCLNRDPKARPLMSEVVQILTPLPHLKDMASSSPHFQAMQAEGMGSNLTPRSGNTVQAGVLPRTARSTGASPISSSPHVSPYRLNRGDTVQTGAPRTARSTGASPIPNSPHVSPYRLNRSPKPIAQSSRSPKPIAQSSRSPKPSAQQP